MPAAIEPLERRALLSSAPLATFNAELARVRRDLAAYQRVLSADTAAQIRDLKGSKSRGAVSDRAEATRFLRSEVVAPVRVATAGLKPLAARAAAFDAAARRGLTDQRVVTTINALRAATATTEDQLDDVIDGQDTDGVVFSTLFTAASAKGEADAAANTAAATADATAVDAATNALAVAYSF